MKRIVLIKRRPSRVIKNLAVVLILICSLLFCYTFFFQKNLFLGAVNGVLIYLNFIVLWNFGLIDKEERVIIDDFLPEKKKK